MEAPPPCIGAPRIRLRPLRHPRMACKHDEKSRLKMKSKTNRLQELKRPNNVIKVSLPASAYYDLDSRSEEHTSELQSLMRISYAFFFFKKIIFFSIIFIF